MLRDFAEAEIPPELIVAAQLLDAYYIPARYPNEFSSGKPADYFNREKAEQAIQAAHAIIQFCQNLLAGS